ncbi:type 4a pilus biogenesis protein PilO [Desulfococcaceae bacterium HSG8]|nr:type 4a pilus biogenesis protein PilO [Desulfococcaceae bacterium HSG8]
MDISASLAPLVEKIGKLSKGVKIGICVASIVIVAAPFIYFSYIPKFDEIKKLKTELKKIEGDLAKAKKEAGKLKNVEKRMREVEKEFSIAKKALPESAEIPGLLTSISRAGQDSGLEFLLFQPEKKRKRKKKKKKKKGEKEEKAFYVDIPIDIEVLGNYHNGVLFFDKVARLPRIVNIKDIRVVPAKKGKSKSTVKENELVVACKAITYQFIEDTGSK